MSDEAPPPPRLRETPSFRLVVDNTGKVCSHAEVVVCRYRRVVECGRCGAPLDAFNALLRIAAEHDRWSHQLKATKGECENARVRLQELKRLEANAVARLKRRGLSVGSYHERVHAAEELQRKR